MVKLAWNMIVKGSDKEAEDLDRCLSFINEHVDGIFIAITNKKGEETNKKVIEVCEKYKVIWKPFEWVYDFSIARNFAMKMIPSDFTHWGWCDADDGVRGIEKARATLEKNPDVDLFTVNYLFHFNTYKAADVVHQKTMFIKNNGCVEWYRPLHEDFKELRETKRVLIKSIERLHLADEEHFEESKKRNLEIAKVSYESNPTDPGFMWNYGQSLFGSGKWSEAMEIFQKFIKISQSEEEKYLVYIKIGQINEETGDKTQSISSLRQAIGMRPEYPDAYNVLGQIYFNRGNFSKAAEMLLAGLSKKPPYHSIIVYNPRDYDFYPMLLLAKTFFNMARPDQAHVCARACMKMQPENKEIQVLCNRLNKEVVFFNRAMRYVERLNKITDTKKFIKYYDMLPEDIKPYPGICALKNTKIIKEKSSGRDLVIYAGFTELPWSPAYAKKKGVGGSEEAVLNLAKQWFGLGWNVTVYCNTGNLGERDNGVTYEPFWKWNYRDKQDVVILWRSPKAVDYGINADKILVDVHDVIPPGEFTPDRLNKIHKVMLKTQFHRSLFPNVSDEKVAVIPNGMDFDLFKKDIKKDQYLIVNTSSPDRSLDVLPKLFKKVKERVPEAKCKWAYGFDIFDRVHSDHPIMMEWKDSVLKEMKEAGIENLGRLTQKKCAELYLEGNVLAYPTEFAEIDCITVKKAQACGCKPITTDFGALNESVQYGVKVHSFKTGSTWCKPNQFYFGLEDEKSQEEWVEAVVKTLQTPIEDRTEMKQWTDKFSWDKIAKLWNEVFTQ